MTPEEIATYRQGVKDAVEAVIDEFKKFKRAHRMSQFDEADIRHGDAIRELLEDVPRGNA